MKELEVKYTSEIQTNVVTNKGKINPFGSLCEGIVVINPWKARYATEDNKTTFQNLKKSFSFKNVAQPTIVNRMTGK